MGTVAGSSRKKPSGIVAVMLTAGGLVAGLAAAACCALPLLLATVGLGSAWLFRIAVFTAPHRTAVLIVGGAAIGIAALLLWRQKASACEPGAWCVRPGVRAITFIGLVVGMMLLVAGYIYV
jgi:mercuric ion transport protein